MLMIFVPIAVSAGIGALFIFSAHIDPLTGKIGRKPLRELNEMLFRRWMYLRDKLGELPGRRKVNDLALRDHTLN